MTAASIIETLIGANIAGSLAILAVLALRGTIRRFAGARLAYAAWLVVPIAIAASFLPARTIEAPAQILTIPHGVTVERMPSAEPSVVVQPQTNLLANPQATLISLEPAQAGVSVNWTFIATLVWSAGALSALAYLVIRQALAIRALGPLTRVSSTTSRATRSEVGPAVVGVIAPRIVLPANFEQSFDEKEQKVVIAHEEAHLSGRHTAVKTLAEIAVCLCWFNPLAYLAARAIAMDQELACDETVAARYPADRKAYAGALLKTQAGPHLPLGCYWPAQSARKLKERITLLGAPSPGRNRRMAGAAIVLAGSLSAGVAAWAGQPPRIVPAPLLPGVAHDQPAPQQQPAVRNAGFDPTDPLYVRGKVEKIDFSDTNYVVFVRASSVAAGENAAAHTDSNLWQLTPAPHWGDRETITKDLLNRAVIVRGYNSLDKSCKPACRMLTRGIALPKSTGLPPLTSTSTFAVSDFVHAYDTKYRLIVRGTVQRIDFGTGTFDAYVQEQAAGPVPGKLFQVRAEYRVPRADIERRLLNKDVAVTGWPARANVAGMDLDTWSIMSNCGPVCGIYGTDFAVNDTKLAPDAKKLLATLTPGEIETATPFLWQAYRPSSYMPEQLVVTGRVTKMETDDSGAELWIEEASRSPVPSSGPKRGTIWRVRDPGVAKGTSLVGKTVSVSGMLSDDEAYMSATRNCAQDCGMNVANVMVFD